jgi:hypothetical protein
MSERELQPIEVLSKVIEQRMMAVSAARVPALSVRGADFIDRGG